MKLTKELYSGFQPGFHPDPKSYTLNIPETYKLNEIVCPKTKNLYPKHYTVCTLIPTPEAYPKPYALTCEGAGASRYLRGSGL